MSLPISIVICTYNRADLLKGCLQTILDQTCEKENFEIMVVDNNSQDHTREVVKSFPWHPNLQYLIETRQGLSYARNLGLAKSKGDYVAYLDDDVLVPSGWLKNSLNLIHTFQPALDGLGGPLYPFYTTPKPDWFEDKFAVQMGNKKEPFFLKQGQSFIGANMIWKKDLLLSVEGFKPEFGYVGNIQTLGEETDAYYRAWKIKPSARFLFSPQLVVKHWMPPEKMTLSFRINRFYKQGLTNFLINEPNLDKSWFLFFFKKVLILVKVFLKSILSITKYKKLQKWVYCEFAPVASVWGEISGFLGTKKIS